MAKDVKELATNMVKSHEKALSELKAIAKKKSVTLPDTLGRDDRDHYNDLNDGAAADFDKKYSKLMVDDHEKAIRKVEKMAKDATDPEVMKWAENTLPVLNEHLAHATACHEKHK